MTRSMDRWRVVWSGDAACRGFAEVLADDPPVWAGNNVWATLVSAHATMLVTPKLPAFERCSVAVPHDFAPARVTGVVAAVGGGPHSLLAAATARQIGMKLDVPVRVLTGYRRPDLRLGADRLLEDIALAGVVLPMDAVATDSPLELVASLPAGTVVVIGAPGGSWFQRQLFGPGVRLRAAAPGGAVVVRQAPPRVYQVMRPPEAVGTHMRARDVLELTTDPVVLVAEFGRLVGSVSRSQLMAAPGHVAVGMLAETPVALAADEPVEHVALVLREHRGGPVGVVDDLGGLVGMVTSADIAAQLSHGAKEAS